MHRDTFRAVNAAMEKPIRPSATRRRLLGFFLTAGCGVVLAAFPASLRQEPGAWPFAPGMALADDRRDDDRDDREDDREDREDDRDDREDDRDDRDDDDNSGPGGGDDNDDDSGGDDDDNSGPGNGGDDNDNDDDGGGDDNSGPGNGGNDDDNDDDGGTRYDDDDDDDDNDRPSTNRRIRNITVQYQDGWIERIVDGQYELIDNLNRRVILRPATVEDFERMMALG
jgi:hypothetical protein